MDAIWLCESGLLNLLKDLLELSNVYEETRLLNLPLFKKPQNLRYLAQSCVNYLGNQRSNWDTQPVTLRVVDYFIIIIKIEFI